MLTTMRRATGRVSCASASLVATNIAAIARKYFNCHRVSRI
jgi:hypothetical protein